MKLVLDTNVVLDWLVFDDPSIRVLVDCIDLGRVTALATKQTIDELRRVLGYPLRKLDAQQAQHVFERFEGAVQSVPMPPSFARDHLMLPSGFPRCRDSDDDVFLALTYHAKADALVTKDKALLKLRKKALRFGVRIAALSELGAIMETMKSSSAFSEADRTISDSLSLEGRGMGRG